MAEQLKTDHMSLNLTPQVDNPLFAATVAAAALSTATVYQEDPVYHSLDLKFI